MYNWTMSNTVSIDASKARKDFFKILEDVGNGKNDFLIKKSGIPVARVVSVNNDFDIMELAGSWKDIDSKAMINYIYEGRKDKSVLERKLPKLD